MSTDAKFVEGQEPSLEDFNFAEYVLETCHIEEKFQE